MHRWVENHPQRCSTRSRTSSVVTALLLPQRLCSAVRYLVGSHGVVEELRGVTQPTLVIRTVRQGVVSPVQGLGSKVDNSHQALVEGAEEGALMAFVGEAHICEVAASVAESLQSDSCDRLLRPSSETRLLEWSCEGLPPTGPSGPMACHVSCSRRERNHVD